MRKGSRAVLTGMCVGLIAAATPVSAQDRQVPVLPSRVIAVGAVEIPVADGEAAKRLDELRRWIDDYGKWKRWNEVWRNRPEPGWTGARDRRKRPDPPPWLAAVCRGGDVGNEGILADGCRAWSDWRDEAAARLRRETTVARTQKEAPTRTVWWEHIHLDALWPMTQARASVFGVLGVHATIEVAGRFQVFAAPGAILLNLPGDRGSREWRSATDWGIAYRCLDFTLPGTDRGASLHFNLAKAWILGGPKNVVPGSINLAGFSVTLKKTRQP